MKQPKLKAEKREIIGKKVKSLRSQGILPTNLYGKKIKSQALQVVTEDFVKVFEETGSTGLVELSVKGATKTHPVLINNIHTHPVSSQILHADFQEVELKEKMTVEVPVKFEGESPAAAKNIGVLLQLVDKLEVEALPTNLPDEILVDISILAEIGQEVKVSDLKSGKSYEILADADQSVVKINPLQKEEEAEPATEEGDSEATTEDGDEKASEEGNDQKAEEGNQEAPKEDSSNEKKEE